MSQKNLQSRIHNATREHEKGKNVRKPASGKNFEAALNVISGNLYALWPEKRTKVFMKKRSV